MRIHMENLIIPDLVTVVSTETPLDIITVFVESTDIKKDIITRIFYVNNLSGISFLNCGGGVAKAPV